MAVICIHEYHIEKQDDTCMYPPHPNAYVNRKTNIIQYFLHIIANIAANISPGMSIDRSDITIQPHQACSHFACSVTDCLSLKLQPLHVLYIQR